MIAFLLLILLSIGLVAGSLFGHAVSVFTSWPFVVCWAVTAAVSAIEIVRRRLYSRPAIFSLHLALLLILCGALATHLWGESQSIHLRCGQTEFIGRNAVTLTAVEIKYAADGVTPLEIDSALSIDGKEVKSRVNHPASAQGLQLCQTAFDSDGHGLVLAVASDPVGWSITLAAYVLLLISMICTLNLKPLLRIVSQPIIAIAIIGVLTWVGWQIAGSISQSHSLIILRSPLLIAHVACVMLAYGLLAIIAVCGIASLLGSKSALSTADAMLRPALYLLMAGIFIGAVWARVSWGRYWGWDPKETWALITLLVYALPLHRPILRRFCGAKFRAFFYAAAFTTVIMTYFGVNYLLGGLHSYS